MRGFLLTAALLYSGLTLGYDHTLTIDTVGGTSLPTANIGDTVTLQLDTQLRDQQIWGSVQIEYDPTVLKALFVDESYDLYGYTTWWIDAPGFSSNCGGGTPYYYSLQGGSSRADEYALEYGDGIAGPTAYIDNSIGRVRFYQDNFLSDGNYRPLFLGFELLKTGNTTITVKSQGEHENYGWCILERTASSSPSDAIVVIETPFSFGL